MDTRHLIAYLLIALLLGALAAVVFIGRRRQQQRRELYRGRRNHRKPRPNS